MRAPEGLGRGGHILLWPGHAKSWSHPLPAMSGLACEVGDFVHDYSARTVSNGRTVLLWHGLVVVVVFEVEGQEESRGPKII